MASANERSTTGCQDMASVRKKLHYPFSGLSLDTRKPVVGYVYHLSFVCPESHYRAEIGLFFSALVMLTAIRARYTAYSTRIEEFRQDASRSVNARPHRIWDCVRLDMGGPPW